MPGRLTEGGRHPAVCALTRDEHDDLVKTMKSIREITYSISAVAVVCFFLVPDPIVSVVGALLLQTLAFMIIAGKSTPDGLLLTGVSFLLIGMLPSDHPFVSASDAYQDARWVLLAIGAALSTGMFALIVRRLR